MRNDTHVCEMARIAASPRHRVVGNRGFLAMLANEWRVELHLQSG